MTKGASSTDASSSAAAPAAGVSGTRLSSLPPVVAPRARVLVLGSMPGVASLQAQRYYAHPRNMFWPMVERFLGIAATLPYEARIAALQRCGVALWDVLAHCERRGSLDGAILRASEVANAIPSLLEAQPSLSAVVLNGQRAATSFRRHLQAQCLRLRPMLHIHVLPSTSPANQSIPLQARQQAWSVLADYAGPSTA
ncbi:DNA-deoxyinosine glycosylase [Algiphilus sp. NNCM1]|uniref:DNA-deoxyinosine glycosylase n=1 Tax=Algiphilus sp. TaxID=1872431 RepID=UPI001CA65BF4|nr:DNA-deoxyinosine glycosylase [Algiphilus sp.]MBY8965411.1 DNA-deoxyinosine glycosylase [Algiphilus acroporae]MCI5103299.1 DNA-deoxyinosine glycosylase [Algiphilus sp.]